MPTHVFVNDQFLANLPSVPPVPKDSVNESNVIGRWNFGFTSANSGFKMVLEGKEHYTINGKHHELNPGQLLWVNAGDELVMENEKNTQGLSVNISPSTLNGFLKDNGFSSARLAPMESGVISTLLSTTPGALLQNSWQQSFRLLLQIQDKLSTASTRLPHKKNDSLACISLQMQEAARLLSVVSHFDKNLSYFASACAMSAYHFVRCFTAFYGLSPKKHHIQVKLQHAKQELLNGNNILPYYFQYGYSDYSTFSRAFKAQHGVSPKKLAINAKCVGG